MSELEGHTISKSNNRTFKLIALSSLVTSFKFKKYLKNIQRSCFQIIGDPLIKRHWVSASLSSRDSELVGKAQKILIMLLNKDFIEVFFSRLVQDSRREKFWLQFVDEIEDVKFIGNTLNYQILKNIESVSKYVDSRYSVIGSNQSTSAIIIWAKGYVFVEFTDVGALYIYKKSSFKIKLKHVSNLRELKVWPKGSSAIRNDPYRSGYYELSSEGTLNHSGAWEQRLQVWMKKYY